MTSQKGVRLFKVLRELNVARDTLLDYLKEQGYGLEGSGPNARLSEEVYGKVLSAFADEKQAVERHVKRVRELRKEGMIDDGPALEYLHDATDSTPVAKPVAVEEPEPEPAPQPIVAEAEPEPEPLAEEPAEQPAEEPVVAEPAELIAEEEPVATELEVEPEAPEIAEPQADESADANAEAEADIAEVTEVGSGDDGQLIKAGRYTLTGPRLLGKVDLGSFAETAESRKKRKRRKKKKSDDVPPVDEKDAKKLTPLDAASKKKRKRKSPSVDQEQVDQAVHETLRNIEQSSSRVRQRRRRMRREEHAAQRQREADEAQVDAGILRIMEFITASELADSMGVAVTEIIRVCLELGTVVSINQRLDADSITLIADEFNFEVEFVKDLGTEDLVIEDDKPEDLQPRSPVVTVMGHVDHGKTSLLDFIRKENVVAGESGGITQHIGAYQVVKDGRKITFLDTPGHQAFTAMRARGAQVTDAVILVVAADDAVMPQTVEAINHAKAAGVPIVVAVNKIDKPGSNPDKVMQGLADENVLVEQYGGKVQAALVSAKTGEGVEELLEKILLEAEVLELKANPNREGIGTVIESRVDKGRGVVTTILVQNGTVHQGDTFVVGAHYGRVRAMFDERENRVQEAGPSQPALILGLAGTPEVGDRFIVLDDEREAREIAQGRQQIQREQTLRMRKHITLDDVGRRLALGDIQALNLIVKADVGGSVEALTDALMQLSSDEVQVHIIHSGVGAINEGDVMLASASDAVIIGFQVRPIPGVRPIAEREEIDIRLYSIIYNAIEDVRDALEGMLSPAVSEKTLGTLEVRDTFKLPKIGMVAGCYVVEGKVRRTDRIRLIREGVVVYEGELGSLRRFKDDVKEVTSGYECGVSIDRYRDIKVGDFIEAFEVIETRRQLPV
ncbi:MAG TPA: translation initiation factor IF-2 [Rhodothermales bacterium]